MFRKWEKEGAAPQKMGNAGQGSYEDAHTWPLYSVSHARRAKAQLALQQRRFLQLRMEQTGWKLGSPLELCVWSVFGQSKFIFLNQLLEGQWTFSLK
jgi:hypothetical protein